MKATAVLATVLASVSICAAQAAEVDQVIVRQQWPWSTDVNVEYRLSGVSAAAPVDIGVEVLNGDTVLQSANLAAAIKGDRYGITKSIGTFTIDPVKAFGTNDVVIESFRVRLTLSPSPDNLDEALYKIFDLSNGACTDVTRKDLLNGKWGTYETDYSRIDPNFTTELDDVLIWTGVTNNIAYKTTHLVMRKIHAANKVWHSGDPEGSLKEYRNLVARYWVKLTYDYYIAVFETTQDQYKKIYGSLSNTNCEFKDEEDSPCYPLNGIGRYNVLGHPTSASANAKGVVTGEQIIFPHNSYVRDVGKDSVCAKMWTKTNYEFNMPTGAEWEFACRGGNDTPLYSGESQTLDHVSKLAWHKGVSSNHPKVVGSLAPNAYGLYDMLGNVYEQTSMSGNLSQGGESGTGESAADPVVNPVGSPASTSETHYSSAGSSFYNDSSTWEYYGSWQDCRSGMRCGNFNWYGTLKYVGFRFVMPARADGQWADHPGQQ